jgi:AcrR family transcriptional regulator
MLRAALLSLMQEKRYDEITVTDILERADVGRSTFYAHYRDKDALLLSGFDDVRAALAAERTSAPDADPIEPVLAVVRHVEAYREAARRIIQIEGNLPHPVVGGLPELTEALVREGVRRRNHPDAVAAEAATQFLSGALVSLLTWWTSYDVPLTPDQLYETYRRLAAGGLNSF